MILLTALTSWVSVVISNLYPSFYARSVLCQVNVMVVIVVTVIVVMVEVLVALVLMVVVVMVVVVMIWSELITL